MSRLRIRFFRVCGIGLFVLAATLLMAQPGYCWDKFAHEVIAQVAYDHMTPVARANADKLITAMANDPHVVEQDARYKPYNFVTASAWMDDMRSTTREFSTWHYIDLPIDNPNLTAADVVAYHDSNTSNAYITLATFCLPTLKNAAAPLADRARALGFFLHLAGDIHQPLHAAGPLAGGNGYKIAPIPTSESDYQITNLHSFWDNAYRYSGKGGKITVVVDGRDLPRIAAPGAEPVESVAKDIEANYMPADPGEVADLDPADWALESEKIAATFVFPGVGETHLLTPDYVQKSHDIACRRLALAGLRVAAVLNVLLGTDTPQAK